VANIRVISAGGTQTGGWYQAIPGKYAAALNRPATEKLFTHNSTIRLCHRTLGIVANAGANSLTRQDDWARTDTVFGNQVEDA
jgi:hypothetical protein